MTGEHNDGGRAIYRLSRPISAEDEEQIWLVPIRTASEVLAVLRVSVTVRQADFAPNLAAAQAIDAEGEAERIRRIARGNADAIFMEKEAEAKGMLEILNRQAEGFGAIVKATNGNSKDAVLMIIADKLEELVKTQVEAIKNIKIDKVTVWENGGGDGEGNATSKFVSGLYKSVPPMSDLFNMAGMDLPQYLGQKTETSKKLIEGEEVVEE